jgi:hypothetical protein
MNAGDVTATNSAVAQGITSVKAGSVAVTFRNDMVPGQQQVIPNSVMYLMPASWFTTELYEPATAYAEFDVVPSTGFMTLS